MERIWCVEDEQSIRDIILYTLNSCGFEGQGFEDGEELKEALEKETPDLILMDIMLPGQSGMELLASLRANPLYASIPVIMTTAKGMEMDKIQALDQGADDYLVKPFGMMEMVARIKAVLRRIHHHEPVSTQMRSGSITLDAKSHEVFLNGNPLSLTRKEFRLLQLFLTSPNRVFTREDLLDQVWHVDTAIETRTVDAHIRSLRTKLQQEGERIETVRGVGYRMRESL